MASPLNATVTESDRDVLANFCIEALDPGFESQVVTLDPTQDRAEESVDQPLPGRQRFALSERESKLLERAIDLMIHAHGGDSRAVVAALGGGSGGAKSLTRTLRSDDAPRVSEIGPSMRMPVSEERIESSSQTGVTPEAIGRYEILGELGRGGLGCVLIGLDMHVRREVAIKRLLSYGDDRDGNQQADSSPSGSRFLREARLTAQLEHPGIVPIHEVGRRLDGTLYYTMRLVRGRTLAAALRACTTVEDRLRLLHHFADVCGAVAFAHSRGVIHRDLKPQNVMIGEFTETVLIDWGLAKVATEKENRTFEKKMQTLRGVGLGASIEGGALGTPEYMPPEQAFGDIANIDETSDVYSLGAVLYQLLTGNPPFEGRSPIEVLLKVQRYGQGREHLVPVRQIVPDAPPELAAVTAKALHPQQAQRYRSAKELLDEINAFREGRRVKAYTYSRSELITRFVRKHRALSVMAVALTVALVGFVAAFAYAWQREVEASRRIHWDMSEAYVEKAEKLAEARDLLGARIYAAAALRDSRYNEKSRHPDLRAIAAHEGDASLASLQSTLLRANHLSMSRFVTTLGHFNTGIEIVVFSPDGTLLASVGTDRTVRVWNVASKRQIASRTTAHRLLAAVWSPDGKTLALGEGDQVVLWEADGKSDGVVIGKHGDEVTSLVYSPDGTQLASASKDWSLCVWNLKSRQCEVTLKAEDDESYPELVRFAPDGKQLVSGGQSRNVLVWNIATASIVDRVTGFDDGIAGLRVTADNAIWLLDNDHTARQFDPKDRSLKTFITLGGGRPSTATLRIVGELLLAVGRGNTVELWDPHSGREVEILRGHDGHVRSVSFSSDGKTFASGALDGRINLWEIEGNPKLPRVPCEDAVTTSLSLSPDSARLVAGERNGQVHFWDVRAGRSERRWSAHDSAVEFVAHTPASTIVTAARDGSVRHWAADGKSLLGEFRAFEKGTSTRVGFALSPDGRILAAGEARHGVNLWSVGQGELLRTLVGHKDRVVGISFSPDGASLATGSWDRTVRVWNLANGQARRTMPTPDEVRAVSWAPNGRWIAASDLSMSVALFDADTGDLIKRFGTRHHDPSRALVFSADSSLLATANASDTRVNIWSVPEGRLMHYADMPALARAIAFLPSPSDNLAIALCSEFRFVAYRGLEVLRQEPVKMLEEAERDGGMKIGQFGLVPRTD